MKYEHLTIPQQNIWNLQKFYEDTAISNLCGAVFYKEKRDSLFLQQAVRCFIQSQSALRLRFCIKDEPKQYVTEQNNEQIPVMTFSSMKEFDNYAEKFAKEPLGLIECPMYRFVVFEVENKSGILILLSHLISDAWTFGLMLQQLDVAYHQLKEGKEVSLPEGDYTDYIQSETAYLQSERYGKDRNYWEEKYANRPEESPIRLCNALSGSIAADRITRILPFSLEQKIEEYCKSNSVTQAVLFETALIIYLSKINSENRTVTIGVPVLNRGNAIEKDIAGMFVTTMPFTVTVSDEMTVLELSKQITKGHMELFRHQKYPYSDILKNLREKQNFSGNLYDVMISYQNARTHSEADTKWYCNGYSEVPLVIHIDNRDGKDSHTINVDYQTKVFRDVTEVAYLIDRLEYILEQIVVDHGRPIQNISVVPPKEWEKIVCEFNDTYVDYPREKCVHELFSEQAGRTPEKTALVFEDQKFTYRQLDEMSNSLAHFLRKEKGVKPNEIVPIIAKRSWHVIVGMLGVMKAGGAYMPISPDYPADRVAYMLEQAQSRIALLYGCSRSVKIEYIDLEEFDYMRDISRIENVNSSKDAAYVIFTSGSTGRPKGVIISHSSLVNFNDNNTKNEYQKYAVEKGNTMLAWTPFIFDISIFEIYMSLLNGLSVILTNEQETNSPPAVAELIEKNGINILQCTPTKMLMCLENNVFKQALSLVHVIMIGAEEFTYGTYCEISSHTSAAIFNGYGPTETTIGNSFKRVSNRENITIGKPIANTQIYILDKDNSLLPIGVVGELCVAGEGVGKGYLNRPELTAERFVLNPFATEENCHGKVMYRTGDLARWRLDGEIEYLGRIDTQVKIRGLRVELGEIESVMGTFDGINMTAVSDKKDGNGRQYLVGYYTSEKKIDEKRLRSHLSERLPRYMIPNYFMRLEQMPMTTSGKTDRRSLPEPEAVDRAGEFVEPSTGTELIICEGMGELFEGRKIGVNDDFFEIGGDSLLAMMLTALLSAKGIAINIQDIYEHPTPSELGWLMDHKRASHTEYHALEFQKYEDILKHNRLDASYALAYQPLGNVLITGTTGFLGAHLLDALARQESGTLYCLVRDVSKLDRILEYYFGQKYTGKMGKRIIPVTGDVTDADSLRSLPKDVQTVIHAAANVKHYGEYFEFERMNVTGTKNMLEYADAMHARFVHISTTSVGGMALNESGGKRVRFAETNFYIGQNLDNVYIRSKFEAERFVLDAIAGGRGCKIFRVGNLTNRSADGMFQPNYQDNAFLKRFKAFLNSGMIPDILAEETVEMTPVDLAAEAILRLAEYADGRQTVFHISNSRNAVTYRQLSEMLGEIGIRISVKDTNLFLQTLKSNLNRENSSVVNEMNELGAMSGRVQVKVDNGFTDSILSKAGFVWADISEEYLRKYVGFFKKAAIFPDLGKRE